MKHNDVKQKQRNKAQWIFKMYCTYTLTGISKHKRPLGVLYTLN